MLLDLFSNFFLEDKHQCTCATYYQVSLCCNLGFFDTIVLFLFIAPSFGLLLGGSTLFYSFYY